ncbi:hypothetical protein [Algicella marina]|uniref:DUF4440 domain-containing protein n=1 Tax=Algicella marina TaxID=2683284 RepID=A0A6P1T1C0_9RHOB|nr:hypothetical protein [Algicella marina]QHQ35555.1 hypothetical protein GO499_10365 [Algicella marina]
MQAEFARKLRTFAEALQDGDIAATTDWNAFPLTLVRNMETRIFAKPEDLQADFADVWGAYADSGIAAISPRILSFRSYDPGVAIADVEWMFYDKNGAMRHQLYSTYTLRNTDKGPMVCVVVSHNEMRERPGSPTV